MAAVLLLTDRPEFDATWGAACRRAGLAVQTHAAGDFADLLTDGLGVVIDGGGGECKSAELLARTALVRVRGAIPAVALPQRAQGEAIADLLMELCGGLVAASEGDIAPVVAALHRRCERKRAARFAYLGVAPGSADLLAVFLDGRTALLARPLGPTDDASDVVRIELREDSSTAHIWLRSGSHVEIQASDVAPSPLSVGGTLNNLTNSVPAGIGDVDGVRLGQRLRALRLAAGLTQAELARRTGIHRPNIARVEAGRHTPSLETLARLAAAIGVSTTRVLAD